MKICPICGEKVQPGVSLVAAQGVPDSEQHRCSDNTLRGIDAAMSVEERKPRDPSYSERLRFGFDLLNG